MAETSFGEILRQAREANGLTLEQAEEATKIRKYYLRALEEDNFKVLPAQVYAIGFVRRYSNYLGLDENEMVHLYKQVSAGDLIEEEVPEIKPVMTERKPFRGKVSYRALAAAVVFLVLAIWIGNYVVGYFGQRAKHVPTPSKTPVAENKKPSDKQPPIIKPTIPDEGVTVKLTGTGDCWYSVRVDGVAVEQGMLRSGDVKEYKGKDTIALHLGNAGGVMVSVDGEEPHYLGGNGEVVKEEFKARSQP